MIKKYHTIFEILHFHCVAICVKLRSEILVKFSIYDIIFFMDALKFAEFFSLKYLLYGLKMLPWQYLDAARYCRYDFLWFCKTALWLEISIFSLNQSKWYENLLEFTSLGKYQVRKVSVILLVMTLVWFFMFFYVFLFQYTKKRSHCVISMLYRVVAVVYICVVSVLYLCCICVISYVMKL